MYFAVILLSGGKMLLDLQKELDEAELWVTQPPTVRSLQVHRAGWSSVQKDSAVRRRMWR